MTGHIPGVRALDHTADVGLALEAPDLPGLLRAGILGMAWLLTDKLPGEGGDGGRSDEAIEGELDVEARDAPSLLRNVLREVLHWHEDRGVVPVEVRDAGTESRPGGEMPLRARLAVTLVPGPETPAREIKGVTLHALEAAPGTGGGWAGRVIFDI